MCNNCPFVTRPTVGRLMLLAVVATVLKAAAFAAVPPKTICGLWRAVSLEQADQKLPDDAVRQLVLVIREKTIVMRRGARLIAETRYTLDAKQDPPAIDLTYEGQPTQGICQRKGDTLLLCLADAGQGRPKNFAVGTHGGKMLLTFKSADDERRSLYVMGADGKNVRPLLSLPEYTAIGSPDWSCDNKRIAFDAWRSVFGESFRYAHAFVANADGSGVRDLGDGAMPGFSPDGKRLCLSRYGEHRGVWLVNADGTGAELLDNEGWGIDWCPRGNRVAYTAYRNGANIYVVELGNRQSRTLLTRSYRQIYWNMHWSPDGQWIAFRGTTPEGQTELAAVHADGESKGFKVLLNAAPKAQFSEIIACVAWGGDGKRVLACTARPGVKEHKMYFVDFAQKDPPQLVPGQDPAWNVTSMARSPDGKKILFTYTVAQTPAPPTKSSK